jgi:Phage integrase, N-terminal SAM-like domain
VTTLMQRMREELVRRNYAGTTIHSYLKAVEHFQQHVNRPFEELGADDIRSYHAYLLEKRKLAVNTVVLNICATPLPLHHYGNSLNAPTGFFTSIVEGCV